MKANKVAVIGAGSWGTALARVLSVNVSEVVLWSNEKDHIEEMQRDGSNERFFPGIKLPSNFIFTADLEFAVKNKDLILLVVPSHAFKAVSQEIKNYLGDDSKAKIVWATKGLDPETGEFLDKIAEDIFKDNNNLAVISGPSFAKEVIMGRFTAVVVASCNKQTREYVRDLFATPYFRVYLQDDVVGVEIGGAIKNLVAFAVGAAEGLNLGANARAALITRGFREMLRLADAVGANESTLTGLSGLGDLILTATDNLSRNRSFGLLLGKGNDFDGARKQIGQEIECINAAKNVHKLIKKLNLDLPICNEVYLVLTKQKSVSDGFEALLTRDLKFED